jgi:chloramphenicol O-acetyltransferase
MDIQLYSFLHHSLESQVLAVQSILYEVSQQPGCHGRKNGNVTIQTKTNKTYKHLTVICTIPHLNFGGISLDYRRKETTMKTKT